MTEQNEYYKTALEEHAKEERKELQEEIREMRRR